MSDDALEALLERLSSGDTAAAGQVFLAYEPYLRMVVRRQLPARLRAKFDSVDVVQSVWADILEGLAASRWRFADANHLRAFLVKVTRNRFIDRVRRHSTALEREVSLTAATGDDLPSSPEPRPSEVAEAGELWVQILALCPPAHHEVIRLKRQGLSLAEISARTGFHPSSVRRILYDLARRLASQQSAAPSAPMDS